MGGKSNSTASSTSSQYYDSRSVVDAGGGIVGNGNSWDQSQTFVDATQHLTSSTDNSIRMEDRADRRVDNSIRMDDRSDRRVDNSQRFDDRSDRRVDNSVHDSSDRRVDNSIRMDDRSDRRVNISTSDGAFDVVQRMADQVGKMGQAQTEAARDIALKGAGAGDEALKFARRSQEDAASFNTRAADRSFDLAGQAQKFAQNASDSALSFTKGTFDDVMAMAQGVVKQAGANAASAADVAKGAYDSAASTAQGNKTLIYVAIGAVVLVGGLVALKA